MIILLLARVWAPVSVCSASRRREGKEKGLKLAVLWVGVSGTEKRAVEEPRVVAGCLESGLGFAANVLQLALCLFWAPASL